MKQIILFKVRIVPYNKLEHCASIVFHIAINLFGTGSLWYANTYNNQNKNEKQGLQIISRKCHKTNNLR